MAVLFTAVSVLHRTAVVVPLIYQSSWFWTGQGQVKNPENSNIGATDENICSQLMLRRDRSNFATLRQIRV